MKKLLHHLFVEESTIFGPQTPSEYTFGEIVADAVTSPFQLLKWLASHRSKPSSNALPRSAPRPCTPSPCTIPPQPPEPPKPTLAELRAQLKEDLRNVDPLPIDEWEKEEVRAQLQLAFLKKTEGTMNSPQP